MRAAIYARFSSDNQNPRSCEDQIAFVTPWITGQGWEVAAVYQDDAVSGREIIGRRAWQRLLRHAEQSPRPFDVVVLEALDRWGREFFSQLDGAGRLHRVGVKLADPSGGLIDLGSLVGQIRFSIEAASSANVSQKISEHTKRGLQQRMGHVSRAGGPVPYGYIAREYFTGARDARGRQIRERVVLEVDPETAPTVARIFRLRVQDGLGWKAIARILTDEGVPSPRGSGYWHAATVRSMCRNPSYAGHTRVRRWEAYRDGDGRKRMRKRGDGELIEGTHPPLVDQETFDEASRTRPSGTRKPSRGPWRPLSGIFECGTCGARMSVLDRRGYGCSSNLHGGDCTNRVRLDPDDVQHRLRAWLSSDEGAAAAVAEVLSWAEDHEDELLTELADAEAALQKASRRHQNVAGAIAAMGTDKALLEQLESARRAVSAAEGRLEEAQAATDALPTADAIARNLRRRSVEEWLKPVRFREIVSRAIAQPDGTITLTTTVGRVAALCGHRRPISVVTGGRQMRGIAPTVTPPHLSDAEVVLVAV